MRRSSGSRTAQYVAQVRAVLHHKGVINDPYAAQMLSPSMRVLTIAMTAPLLRRRTESSFFAALATRTRFFDEQVLAALENGIDQIVILAAGYDSRAWRFGRAGVAFFEADHPATQRHKRRRAPSGGPIYVPADLEVDNLESALRTAGWRADAPTLFTVEGLTMYLETDDVRRLLGDLAVLSAPRSRLAVNFAAPPGTGQRSDRRRQSVLRLAGRVGGEAHRSFMRAPDAGGFVTDTGWTVDVATSLRDAAPRLLGPTTLDASGINPDACAVAASRV